MEYHLNDLFSKLFLNIKILSKISASEIAQVLHADWISILPSVEVVRDSAKIPVANFSK